MAKDVSFCTECGEPNYFNEPTCEYCGVSFPNSNGAPISGTPSKPIQRKPFGAPVPSNQAPIATDPMDRLVQLMELSIQAQNRTTRAVRAFVRFLFIQLSATTLAIILWNLAQLSVNESRCFSSGENCSGNPFLILLAVIVYIAGVAYSSQQGWEELKASDIQ
jgi:hypothetical protein